MQRRQGIRPSLLAGSPGLRNSKPYKTVSGVVRQGANSNRAVKIILLSCVSLALLFYALGTRAALWSSLGRPKVSSNSGVGPGRVSAVTYDQGPTSSRSGGDTVEENVSDDPRISPGFRGASHNMVIRDDDGASEEDRVMSKYNAGWGGIPDEDLELWAPLGVDPQGTLQRSLNPINIQVAWGFGSNNLNLYSYRALESILHVYPEACVRFITIGKSRSPERIHSLRS
ncbi:unnamed protein product [Choristocarpus tenellus]